MCPGEDDTPNYSDSQVYDKQETGLSELLFFFKLWDTQAACLSHQGGEYLMWWELLFKDFYLKGRELPHEDQRPQSDSEQQTLSDRVLLKGTEEGWKLTDTGATDHGL